MRLIKRWIGVDESLLPEDLYIAQVMGQGPGKLTLRKVCTGFDPNDHSHRPLRRYYVVYTHRQCVYARRFRLTELTAARRHLHAPAVRTINYASPNAAL